MAFNPKILYLLVLILLFNTATQAQRANNDTILVSGRIIGNDTFIFSYLREVEIIGILDPQRKAELDRLRYNVYKVYPYAVTAAAVPQRVDNEIAVRSKRRDRRAYIKATEKELSEQFKGELKNLTMTQGQILVKLINRQTGRETYEIIKQLKGGLNARIYQTTAFFFDNNLKTQYDPYNEDKDIELIVQEIEEQHFLQPRRVNISSK